MAIDNYANNMFMLKKPSKQYMQVQGGEAAGAGGGSGGWRPRTRTASSAPSSRATATATSPRRSLSARCCPGLRSDGSDHQAMASQAGQK